ncbi:hypothetical protein PILCRDRAFT_91123 [Piloderma croceum F 1598]|uniref:Uncharacterized protein n=1 Tax=Piloderma croceum (strain F 1598) TaxID=765440 RepID=A0A0C3BJ26_PILCF|nr:hypothetical protein PILCRDRAFT_91123 [Piloderma croceum F 1598]
MSTPVPPLFKHTGPPPPLPLLTSQTNIAYIPIRLYTITAHEEISSVSQTIRHHSVPPTPKSKGIIRFQSLPPDNASQRSESSLSSLSSLSLDSESEASEDSDGGLKKIPKLPGEAGRPGRGGYTLRDDYKKLLDYVEKQAIEDFPILDNYADCWPVNDMLLARLKTSSMRNQKRQRDRVGAKALEEVEQLKKKEKKKKRKMLHVDLEQYVFKYWN